MFSIRKSGLANTSPASSPQPVVSGLAVVVAVAAFMLSALPVNDGRAGEVRSGYRVISPITHGNLTIFPVVAASSHDTHDFLTLDEGLRSGEVVVTETGKVQPLMRRRSPRPIWRDGAQVNRLALVNNSDRPLILLAGEIVTGGKQDRVVAKDRIVPPDSDPIDLSVFCVEPGRWVETASSFNSRGALMAQPSVRRKAMVDKDQQKVWAEVRKSTGVAEGSAGAVGGPLNERPPVLMPSTTSYARVMGGEEVKSKVDAVSAPLQHSYEKLMRELRAQNAVGVVVGVNGESIWADVFASTSLLEKYWPKLVRSYATEAMTTRVGFQHADLKSAQAFLENLAGKREVVESEPGVYRHTEISGDGFTAFELTSLLPKTGFAIHIAKMAE